MSTFADILDHMREIHEAKNNDYSPEGEFGNFAESERVGVEAWRGAFIRLQDKYTRCCNLIQGKEQMVKDEALEDTLLDLANYAVIVLCLRKFERDEVRPDVPRNPFESDAVFHDHSERIAADKVKETLRWRQGDKVLSTEALAEALRKLVAESEVTLEDDLDHTCTDEEPEHRVRPQWEIDGERKLTAAEREDGVELMAVRWPGSKRVE